MSRTAVPMLAHGRAVIELFGEAAANASETSRLLSSMFWHWPERGELAREIRGLEREGDRITHDVIAQLERTYALPFDREDGHRLITAIDDIVDYADEAAEHVVIYKVHGPSEHARALADLLEHGTRQLALDVPHLAQPASLGSSLAQIAALDRKADRTLRDALSALFDGERDPLDVLRWKDIFERLRKASASCDRAGRLMQGIRIKNT